MSTSGLKRLVKECEKHPKDYTPGHILLKVLYASEGSISRTKLKRLLRLGEGSVKSLMKCMWKYGLLSFSPSGSRLTKKGMGVLNRVRLHVKDLRKIDLEYLSVGRVSYVAILRRVKMPDALKLRDRVVRLGGVGAVILFVKEGAIKVPYVIDDLKTVSEDDYERLSKIDLEEDDLILIVGGENDGSTLSAIGSILFELLLHQA
ncbi:MAG: DUF4443 domain-containing protein [Thermoproteota archaeon]